MAIKEHYDYSSSVGKNYETEINKSILLVEEMQHEFDKYEKLLKLAKTDRVNMIKSYVDYMTYDIYIPSAKKWFQMINNKETKIDKRKKYPEKEMFDGLIHLLKRDFFGDRDIEITGFCQGGYESYYNQIALTCNSKRFYLDIPVMKNISVNNFEYAHEGKLIILLRTSDHCATSLCSSYKEEDIKKAIDTCFHEEEANV